MRVIRRTDDHLICGKFEGENLTLLKLHEQPTANVLTWNHETGKIGVSESVGGGGGIGPLTEIDEIEPYKIIVTNSHKISATNLFKSIHNLVLDTLTIGDYKFSADSGTGRLNISNADTDQVLMTLSP
jgi:hypothetical protein